MIEFTDFTAYIIIAIIDTCLIIAGILFGMILKCPDDNFTTKKKKQDDTTIIDVEEVKGIVGDTEYITRTIKTKRKLEKQENEDELE